MGVVRTKSGLTSTTRTTRDQLIIFIDIITKNSFSRGSPTFALHAGLCVCFCFFYFLFNCSHTNLEPHFNIYLSNEEEEREWPPTFRSCGQRSVHPRRLTSDNELSLPSVWLPMAFPLTRDTYRTNKYHHQMSPLHVTLQPTFSPRPYPRTTSHSSPTISTSQTFADPFLI